MAAQAITREQIHELLDLILDINGMEQRNKSITGDKPTAFMWFSGHTFAVDIMIHKRGWDFDNFPDINYCVDLIDGKTKIFSSIFSSKTLDDVMEELKAIKKDRVR